MKRRYTLITHGSAMPGWQVIGFKRVNCTLPMLKRYKISRDVHFVLPGWPRVEFQNGEPFFKANTAKESM